MVKGGCISDSLGGEKYNLDVVINVDVGIKDGIITVISSEMSSAAKQVIDASGAMVTPGFVDIHTHFDGQVRWNDKIDLSFSHGVTSIVMGNCGVGFAPVPPSEEKELIDVMEKDR